MPSAFFLAQTAAQFHIPLPIAAQKAWMACHFSSYGTGLSNLPPQLPPESMVIVNDRTPPAGHDPELIAAQLQEVVETWKCSHILLDFQRRDQGENSSIAKAILKGLPRPVAVSEPYAEGLDCAVFLPPLPLHMTLEDYIAPWQGRPVWLELMPDCAMYTVTESGCRKSGYPPAGLLPHFDEMTCCRYRAEIDTDCIRFTLCRSLEDLARLRQKQGIDCFVGLYQDFAQPVAQATALDQ